MIHGTPTEKPAAAVAVGRRQEDDDTQTHCSGVLIAPTLVLTARHCVDDFGSLDPELGIVCGQTQFEEGTAEAPLVVSVASEADYTPGPTTFEVTRRIREPSDQVCGADVALLELDRPVPAELAIPLVPRFGTDVRQGETLYAIGYGPVAWGTPESVGTRRLNEASVSCLEENCPPPRESALGPLEWLSDETGVCPADSGGPALDWAGMVLGIASRGPRDCSFTIYGNVNAWAEWLRQQVESASHDAGIPAPDWVQSLTKEEPAASTPDAIPGDALATGGCSVTPHPTTPAATFEGVSLMALAGALVLARTRRRLAGLAPTASTTDSGAYGAPCAPDPSGYRPAAMFEPAFLTLVKIVGTLVVAMSVIPILFMSAKGADTSEPKDIFDTD